MTGVVNFTVGVPTVPAIIFVIIAMIVIALVYAGISGIKRLGEKRYEEGLKQGRLEGWDAHMEFIDRTRGPNDV